MRVALFLVEEDVRGKINIASPICNARSSDCQLIVNSTGGRDGDRSVDYIFQFAALRYTITQRHREFDAEQEEREREREREREDLRVVARVV